MAPDSPEPFQMHDLPGVPTFFGRDDELGALRDAWEQGYQGVYAIVGLGGAGKTAVVSQFLSDVNSSEDSLPRPARTFVWSFYRDADTGRFFREAYRYFSDSITESFTAAGLGLLHQLIEAMTRQGRILVILDGLERVQISDPHRPEKFGNLEDPLLRNFLLRFTAGTGQAMVVITSRFPLADLTHRDCRCVRNVELGGLSVPAAIALLRERGVRGDDRLLRNLVSDYGDHALTLDHLGGLIGGFLDGDPSRVSEIAECEEAGAQQSRLARLMRGYERLLPQPESTLLSKLCLLRQRTGESHIVELFLCTPPVTPHVAQSLQTHVSKFLEEEGIENTFAHKIARSVADMVTDTTLDYSVAGPSDMFRLAVLEECAKAVTDLRERHYHLYAEVARAYRYSGFTREDSQHPLSSSEREMLVQLFSRLLHLSKHPALPFRDPKSDVVQTLDDLGYADAPMRRRDESMDPSSVYRSLREVDRQTRHLVLKHHILCRIHDVCERFRHRWELAGELATLDRRGIRYLLNNLIQRHLVLRDSDGSLSVHPAIQDHFRQLATRPEAWHDVIREHLVTLVGKPGNQQIEHGETLDLVEEAIFHSILAGCPEDAFALYENVLGGHPHLAWRLGEMARGLRILQMFDECPDRWALAWYLRALGDLDAAYDHHTLAFFRTDIRLLQGRLPLVAQTNEYHRSAVAAFLMGNSQRIPDMELGCAIPLGQLFLYAGKLDAACRVSQVEELYHRAGWEGDRARGLLVLAEAARSKAAAETCADYIDEASRWITQAGSVEHLSALHLVRARAAAAGRDRETTERAVADGLQIATSSGLLLAEIELLCERASMALITNDPDVAQDAAGHALELSKSPDCQFCWGEADAGHLLGEALFAKKRYSDARQLLSYTLQLRERISHPYWTNTRALLDKASELDA